MGYVKTVSRISYRCGLLFYGQKMKNKWIFFVDIQKKHIFFFIFVEKIDLKNGDVEVMPLGQKKKISTTSISVNQSLVRVFQILNCICKLSTVCKCSQLH